MISGSSGRKSENSKFCNVFYYLYCLLCKQDEQMWDFSSSDHVCYTYQIMKFKGEQKSITIWLVCVKIWVERRASMVMMNCKESWYAWSNSSTYIPCISNHSPQSYLTFGHPCVVGFCFYITFIDNSISIERCILNHSCTKWWNLCLNYTYITVTLIFLLWPFPRSSNLQK